jgi:hypothetical protein
LTPFLHDPFFAKEAEALMKRAEKIKAIKRQMRKHIN